MRKVKLVIVWEQDVTLYSEEIEVSLSDEMIISICKSSHNTLNEIMIFDYACYKLYEEITGSFDETHGMDDDDYQEYLASEMDSESVASYSEWLTNNELYFVISVADLISKYKNQDIIYAVDCYSDQQFLKTYYLLVYTTTQDILNLIDCCLEGKTIGTEEKLNALRNEIEKITVSKLSKSYSSTELGTIRLDVKMTEDIYDLALDFGKPLSEEPKPIQYDELILQDAPDYQEEKEDIQVEEKPEEKTEEKGIEQNEWQNERKVEKQPESVPEEKIKNEKKTRTPLGVIVGVLLVVMLVGGFYVYKEYCTQKSPRQFDVNELAYVKIDGYYDVFDVTLETPEDYKFTVDNLDYWECYKLWDQSEEIEKTDDLISVTYYDNTGKQLEEIICYNQERVMIDGVLYKPDISANAHFALPAVLKSYGKIYMQEALRPEINKMMENAQIENGNVIIDMIEIPYDGGTYLKIWGSRTDSETGKDKIRHLFDKDAQEYEHIAGNKLMLPLAEFLDGEKLHDMWISIEACGVSFAYDISEIIPEELRAEN